MSAWDTNRAPPSKWAAKWMSPNSTKQDTLEPHPPKGNQKEDHAPKLQKKPLIESLQAAPYKYFWAPLQKKQLIAQIVMHFIVVRNVKKKLLIINFYVIMVQVKEKK